MLKCGREPQGAARGRRPIRAGWQKIQDGGAHAERQTAMAAMADSRQKRQQPFLLLLLLLSRCVFLSVFQVSRFFSSGWQRVLFLHLLNLDGRRDAAKIKSAMWQRRDALLQDALTH